MYTDKNLKSGEIRRRDVDYLIKNVFKIHVTPV
jgi:hypothetical protein